MDTNKLEPRDKSDLMRALWWCYFEARKHKLNTADEHKFEINLAENMEQLYNDIINRRYVPSRSKAFITHNPVIREIFAAPFRDRIVHHLLFSMTGSWWDKHFIDDSYSCRKGRGTDYGVERLRKMMNKASSGGEEEAYLIKADITGYFMSLSRVKLFRQILWGLNRQYEDRRKNKISKWKYSLCRYLWRQVIFDDPVDGVRLAGKKQNWAPLPKTKSLFYRIPGIGIVIGNLTSQLLSNIFLDQLDRYIKYELGFKYYGRYVDDFFVVVKKDELEYAMFAFKVLIPNFLECLGLKIHPKKFYVQPVKNGVYFLGKFVHLDHVQLGKRAKDRFYRAAQKRMMNLVGDETITSYLGMGKHYCTGKLNKKVFESVGWEYIL